MRAAIAVALLAASCGKDPVPAPAFTQAPAPIQAPAPAPAPEPVSNPPLAPRPADEAGRLRGLLRLLEWGDPGMVEFAGETLSAFPDPKAAAEVLSAAGRENAKKNIGLVQNILSSIRDGHLGAPMAPFLVECSESGDPLVRRMAVLQYAQSVEGPDLALLARVGTTPWSQAAQAAFQALEIHRGPAAAAALREVFPKIGPGARPAAANALGRLGDPESIPLLRSLLEEGRETGDAGFSLRIGAAQGLARLGVEEGLSELRAYALALPLDQAAVPLDFPPAEWEGPEAVLSAAGDTLLKGRLLLQARRGSAAAAAAAVRVLTIRYAQDGEIAGAVAAAFDRPDADFVLVAEALDSFHAANPAAGTARALATLENPVEERRYGAALALARWKDPETIPALAARLKGDPVLAVRRKCCDALGVIGDPAGAPALVEFLAAETAPTPDRALVAMTARSNLRGAMADAAAEALAGLAGGKGSSAIRFNAALALGKARNSPKARAALEAMLRDPDPYLRTAAADALGSLGDAAARAALAAAYEAEADGDAASAQREAVLRLDLRNP